MQRDGAVQLLRDEAERSLAALATLDARSRELDKAREERDEAIGAH